MPKSPENLTIQNADTPMAEAFRGIATKHAEQATDDAVGIALEHYDLIDKGIANLDDEGSVKPGVFSDEEKEIVNTLIDNYNDKQEVLEGAFDLVDAMAKSERKVADKTAELKAVRTKISRAQRLGMDPSEIKDLTKREQKLVAKIEKAKSKEENAISKVRTTVHKTASDKVFDRANNIDAYEFWGMNEADQPEPAEPAAPAKRSADPSITNDLSERPAPIEDDGKVASPTAKPSRPAKANTSGEDAPVSSQPEEVVTVTESQASELLDEMVSLVLENPHSHKIDLLEIELRRMLDDDTNGLSQEARQKYRILLDGNSGDDSSAAPELVTPVGEPDDEWAPSFEDGTDADHPEPLPQIDEPENDEINAPIRWADDSEAGADEDELDVPDFMRRPSPLIEPVDVHDDIPVVPPFERSGGNTIPFADIQDLPPVGGADDEARPALEDDPMLDDDLRARLENARRGVPAEPVAPVESTATEATPAPEASSQDAQQPTPEAPRPTGKRGLIRRAAGRIAAEAATFRTNRFSPVMDPTSRGPRPTPTPGPLAPLAPVVPRLSTAPAPAAEAPARPAATPVVEAEPVAPISMPRIREAEPAPVATAATETTAAAPEPAIEAPQLSESQQNLTGLQREYLKGFSEKTLIPGSPEYRDFAARARSAIEEQFGEGTDAARQAFGRFIRGEDLFGSDEDS